MKYPSVEIFFRYYMKGRLESFVRILAFGAIAAETLAQLLHGLL